MDKHVPKVAVVLGGGGIKPFSTIPLFSFLDEMNIPVDLLVGCSGGGILATLYSYGYSPDEMMYEILPLIKKSIFKKNWRTFLSLLNVPFIAMDKHSAFFKPEPLRKLALELFKNRRLEELKPKTILQVTDFETGEGIGLESGDLVDCIYASSAIYPFLPPIRVNERWVFDGVFSAPVPILQAVKRNADIIIVMDFLEKIQGNPRGPLDIMMHLSKLYSKTIMANQMALTIDLHHSEIIYIKVHFEKDVSLWETEHFPLILDAGRKAVEKQKETILQVLNKVRSG